MRIFKTNQLSNKNTMETAHLFQPQKQAINFPDNYFVISLLFPRIPLSIGY